MTIIFKNILNVFLFCKMFAAKISYVNVSSFQIFSALILIISVLHTIWDLKEFLPTPVTELIKYRYRIRNNPVFGPLNRGISEWM